VIDRFDEAAFKNEEVIVRLAAAPAEFLPYSDRIVGEVDLLS